MSDIQVRLLHDEIMFRLLIKRDNKTITDEEDDDMSEQLEHIWHMLPTDDREDINRLCEICANNLTTTGYWLLNTDNPRDWKEDFSHENGNYNNICIYCNQEFIGHKRRAGCKICSLSITQAEEIK